MALPKLETPTYELIIPSNNKKITFRPFLVKEHKILMTLSEASQEELLRVIKDLVNVCTFKKLKIDELANFDLEYIFIQLRSKSIGETMDLIINCECGNKIEYTANLLNAKVNKPINHKNKFMINDKIGIEMKYPNFDEVVGAYTSTNSEDIFKLAISCIKGIYDKENYWNTADYNETEVLEFVYSLTKQQFDMIEEFFMTMPKLEQTIEADCDKCGKHNEVKLEGLRNFFI